MRFLRKYDWLSVTGQTIEDDHRQGQEERGGRGVGRLEGEAEAGHGVGGRPGSGEVTAGEEVGQQVAQPGQTCQASPQILGGYGVSILLLSLTLPRA